MKPKLNTKVRLMASVSRAEFKHAPPGLASPGFSGSAGPALIPSASGDRRDLGPVPPISIQTRRLLRRAGGVFVAISALLARAIVTRSPTASGLGAFYAYSRIERPSAAC